MDGPSPNTATASLYLSETHPTPSPTFRAAVTSILVDRGRCVLFVGTPEALLALEEDPEAREAVPPRQRWAGRPLKAIARSARKGFDELFRSGCKDRSVLGVMALPEEVVQAMLSPGGHGRYALVVEGVDPTDPEVEFALSGIRALTERSGTLLATFP